MDRPPVAIVSETISDYVHEVNARDGVIWPTELAHKILEALGLDHSLPVTA